MIASHKSSALLFFFCFSVVNYLNTLHPEKSEAQLWKKTEASLLHVGECWYHLSPWTTLKWEVQFSKAWNLNRGTKTCNATGPKAIKPKYSSVQIYTDFISSVVVQLLINFPNRYMPSRIAECSPRVWLWHLGISACAVISKIQRIPVRYRPSQKSWRITQSLVY